MERHVSSDTKRPKDPSANVLATRSKNASADVPATRPKNRSANILPTEGYVLEIDGKFKSEYETSKDALKAGHAEHLGTEILGWENLLGNA